MIVLLKISGADYITVVIWAFGPIITLENSDIPNLYYPGCFWDCRKRMLGLPTIASAYTGSGLSTFFGLQGIM